MGVRVRMWMWSLTLFCLLLAAPQAQSDGEQHDAAERAETSSEPGLPTWPPTLDCRRCSRTRYRSANEEKCKNCPEGKMTKGDDAERAETSSEPGWPSWPPSQDCRRCSRTRYRSANEEKCKNCPEQKKV